jgi:hypothetical protein
MVQSPSVPAKSDGASPTFASVAPEMGRAIFGGIGTNAMRIQTNDPDYSGARNFLSKAQMGGQKGNGINFFGFCLCKL